MPKRLLDCCASDFRSFSKNDLLESIQKSEGRVDGRGHPAAEYV